MLKWNAYTFAITSGIPPGITRIFYCTSMWKSFYKIRGRIRQLRKGKISGRCHFSAYLWLFICRWKLPFVLHLWAVDYICTGHLERMGILQSDPWRIKMEKLWLPFSKELNLDVKSKICKQRQERTFINYNVVDFDEIFLV